MLSESKNETGNELTAAEQTAPEDTDEERADTGAGENAPEAEGDAGTESKNETETEGSENGEEAVVSVSWFVFDIAGTIILSVVILLLVMALFIRQVTVDGASMNDTLSDGDRLLVQCSNYKPQNGDIVVVTHGKDLDEPIIKRVIATEGQYLDIDYSTGEVTVDGVLLREPYITGPTRSTLTALSLPLTVPEGHVFVMGDNRGNSLDSRSERVGLIPVENIVGKAFFRLYPLNSLGTIN